MPSRITDNRQEELVDFKNVINKYKSHQVKIRIQQCPKSFEKENSELIKEKNILCDKIVFYFQYLQEALENDIRKNVSKINEIEVFYTFKQRINYLKARIETKK